MKQIDLNIKELPIIINICYNDNKEEQKCFVLRLDKEKNKVYLNKIN